MNSPLAFGIQVSDKNDKQNIISVDGRSLVRKYLQFLSNIFHNTMLSLSERRYIFSQVFCKFGSTLREVIRKPQYLKWYSSSVTPFSGEKLYPKCAWEVRGVICNACIMYVPWRPAKCDTEIMKMEITRVRKIVKKARICYSCTSIFFTLPFLVFLSCIH